MYATKYKSIQQLYDFLLNINQIKKKYINDVLIHVSINNVVHFIRHTKSIEFRLKCPKHYQNIYLQNSKK